MAVLRAIILLSSFQLLIASVIELTEFKIPEECQHRQICEQVDDYPTDLAEKLIEELTRNNTFFNYDEVNEVNFIPKILNRFLSEDEEESIICKSKKTAIRPKYATDEIGNGRFILNTNDPIQAFEAELCESPETACNGKFQSNYIAKCVQNYNLRKMYYINMKKSTAEVGLFKVPTCCACVLVNAF